VSPWPVLPRHGPSVQSHCAIAPLCHCVIVILHQRLYPIRPMLAFSYPPIVQVSAPLPHCPIRTHHILIFSGHDVLHSAFRSHPTKPYPPHRNREAAEPGIAGLSLDGAVAMCPHVSQRRKHRSRAARTSETVSGEWRCLQQDLRLNFAHPFKILDRGQNIDNNMFSMVRHPNEVCQTNDHEYICARSAQPLLREPRQCEAIIAVVVGSDSWK